MTTQINLRLTEDFLDQAKEYAKHNGFLNVQEFFREAAREKLFDRAQVSEEYLKKLQSKEARSYLSVKESKDFHKELKKKAGLE